MQLLLQAIPQIRSPWRIPKVLRRAIRSRPRIGTEHIRAEMRHAKRRHSLIDLFTRDGLGLAVADAELLENHGGPLGELALGVFL